MKKLVLSLFILLIPSLAFADKVMERVNKTNTLRCGYVLYSPAIMKDTVTGEVTGFAIDIIEEMGRRLGLKIEWVYETNWPVLSTDLKANKFDAACVTYWSNPLASRQMLATIPFYYQPTFFVARDGDTRFDDDTSIINNSEIRVSVLDGDVPISILNQLYPKAQQVALPQNASFPQVFQEVASKRADVTIAAMPDVQEFIDNNPGVLKAITDKPVRSFASTMMLHPESYQLQHALNTSIQEMVLDKTIETILQK